MSEATPSEAAAKGTLATLDGFTVERLLGEDTQMKQVFVLGRFRGGSEGQQAVMVVSRRHFNASELGAMLCAETQLTQDFANDIYSKYAAQLPPQHSLATVDIIYPATDKHVAKYSSQPRHMVVEDPELYRAVVLPHIQSIPPARIAWVYNILEKKKEAERLIFEDPDPTLGFVLHPDLKWDQSSPDQLYALAIVHRRDLHSLRDLDSAALPLLRNVKHKACQAIQERYGVLPHDLRIYLHYPPSYYHLHIHFAHLSRPDPGVQAGKAVLLDEVIDNIETFGGDFYVRKSLSYVLGEGDDLWKLIAAHRRADKRGQAASP